MESCSMIIFNAQKVSQICTDAQEARSTPEVPKRQTVFTKVPKSQAVLTEGSKSKTGFTKVPNRQTDTQSTTKVHKPHRNTQKAKMTEVLTSRLCNQTARKKAFVELPKRLIVNVPTLKQ